MMYFFLYIPSIFFLSPLSPSRFSKIQDLKFTANMSAHKNGFDNSKNHYSLCALPTSLLPLQHRFTFTFVFTRLFGWGLVDLIIKSIKRNVSGCWKNKLKVKLVLDYIRETRAKLGKLELPRREAISRQNE